MRKELVLIFLFCIKLTFAQLLGKIDSTFNPGDIGYMLRDRANAQVLSIISQPDNKVVLVVNLPCIMVKSLIGSLD